MSIALKTLAYESLTEKIIAAAIEVHKKLGPGFLESIYENSLVIELQERGIEVKNQIEIPVLYRDVEVGKHRIDLVVEDKIIVELKAIKHIEDVHFAIVKSYLRAFGLEHGLILNFAKTTLEIKRVIAGKYK